ncbi:chaplin family protein [Actinoallomurus sp. CA-142502]|uniref:chaplin family protein n=1 Tax=Actinoallomurus sp. CA-142502 TaxID=3239885 RepID=UPI003D93F7AF
MRMWAKGAAGATLLTASFVALGAVPALADGTDGDGSVLGGNQVNAPISVPVNVSGNSVAAIGHAVAGSRGGAAVNGYRFGGGNGHTSGRHSIGGGNQINAPITAPINACGNAVAVIGGSLAGCRGGAAVTGYRLSGGHGHTSGRHSVLGGNQVNAPITAPVNICGNTAAVIGDALAGCRGGAGVAPSGYRTSGGSRTSGRHSILGGNQVHAPVNAPINVCGNAIGNALAGCQGGASVGGPGGYYGHHGFHGRTSGVGSIGGGNQVHAPITAPVDVCGNAAAVLGRAVAGCQGALPGAYPSSGGFHGRTSGVGSIGGGNQVHAPITAPVDACGNAVAVVGHALGSCGATSGGYGDDCVTPYSARMSGLPQLPVDPASLRTGALPVAMGATPALPKLPQGTNPQSAGVANPLGGGLNVPVVGGPPKQLPPVGLAAAESSTSARNGALMALALGGMFAASAGTISVARRLGRRSGR